MQYHEMINMVQREAGLGSDSAAARALRATLSTLATRLAGGQPGDLAAQLPEELQPPAMPASAGAGEEFAAHEFIRRVARELQVTDAHAEREIQAVFATLREAVTPGVVDNLRSQLPPEYDRLVMGTPAPAPAAPWQAPQAGLH